MEILGDLEWVVRAVGDGLPGALAVFQVHEDGLVLAAANDAYLSLFGDPGNALAPRVGALVDSVLPGNDPQIDRILAGVVEGDAFMAESWAIPAPAGTYSTGVAYCDWSLKQVEAFGAAAVVLLLTDATRRTERNLAMAEEVVRLRDALQLT